MATSFEPSTELLLAAQRDALQGVVDMARAALEGVERMSALTLQLTRDSLATTGGQARALLEAAVSGDATRGLPVRVFDADPEWGAAYFAQACAIAADTTESLTGRMQRQVWAAHQALAQSLSVAAAAAPAGEPDDALLAARAMLQATPRTIADVIDAAHGAAGAAASAAGPGVAPVPGHATATASATASKRRQRAGAAPGTA